MIIILHLINQQSFNTLDALFTTMWQRDTSVAHNREQTGPAGDKPSHTTRTPYLAVRGDISGVRGNLWLDPRDTESRSLLQATYRTHAVTWPSQSPWRPQSQPWSREVDFDIAIAQLHQFTGSICQHATSTFDTCPRGRQRTGPRSTTGGAMAHKTHVLLHS